LGNALKQQGKLEESIAAYHQALTLPDLSGNISTTHTLVHNNLGLLYQQQGKLKEAIQEYEAALKIDPKFEYAQSNLQEAQRLLALKEQPAQLIALNETKYLPNDPLTLIKRSIVKIKIDFPGNAKGASYGTGYVIKRQGNTVWIITNRHVVIDQDTAQTGENLEIEPYYGETLPNIPRERCAATIVQISDSDNPDLALLKTTQLPNDIQPLTLEANPPSPNSPVTIIGHPGQNDWLEHQATFMSIKPSSGNLLIDVNLGRGASGSPILDPNRKVIGIMVRTVNESNTTDEAIGIGHSINLVLQQITQWGIQIP
jgi:S1-C subfamily serine protease